MRDWTAPALPARWAASGRHPFVARGEPLEAIAQAWADAAGGAGRTLFVSGDAGTGKSRLVAEACTRLHAAGAAVIVGACTPELSSALAPFEPLMHHVVRIFDHEPPGSALSEPARLLQQFLTRTDAAAPLEFGPERLYSAVVELVRAVALDRPLILVCEDLQWAGVTALTLLTRLIEADSSLRLLTLCTLRESPPDRSDAVAQMFSALRGVDGVERLHLEPFTAAEVAEYVRTRAGTNRAESASVARVLLHLTGGNAFLVRESWRGVLDAHHRAEPSVVAVPESVGDLFYARLSALDQTQRSVLEAAAVLGQEVDLAELISVAGSPAELVLDAADDLVAAGLLDRPQEPTEPYRFAHAIARQLVIDRIPPTQLLRVHARIAQALETDFGAAPHLVQRLAHHYGAAHALGFGDRAVTYLMMAASHAQRRLAHDEAARLFMRAADITSDAEERDALRLRAAHSWTFAADFAKAREQFAAVFDTAGPRMRLKAAIGFEDASWRPGLLGHQAVDMLTAALSPVVSITAELPAELGTSDEQLDALSAEGLAALGRALAYSGRVSEGVQLCDRALARARELGDNRLLTAALRAFISTTLRPRGLAQRIEGSRELRRLTRAHSDEWFGAGAVFGSAGCYLAADRDGLDAAEHDLVEMARQWGSYWRYWVECVQFGRACSEGRFTDAAAAVARAEKTAESSFKSDSTPGAHSLQSYMVRRETGQLKAVRPLLTGRESPESRWAPGLLALYTELEMQEPARRLLAWLLDRDTPAAHESSDWPGRLVFMSEAALWLRDEQSAARIAPMLQEYAGLNLMSGYFVGVFGSADRYLGQIESLCGVGDPVGRFETALAVAARLNARLDSAYTLAAMAAHSWANSAPAMAASLAAEARAIAEPAEMTRVLRVLSAEQALAERRRDAASGALPNGISPRELDVIRLLAEGRSNRDIARALTISEHTAANHVRNILTKIGATNRTQAAIFARQNGMLA